MCVYSVHQISNAHITQHLWPYEHFSVKVYKCVSVLFANWLNKHFCFHSAVEHNFYHGIVCWLAVLWDGVDDMPWLCAAAAVAVSDEFFFLSLFIIQFFFFSFLSKSVTLYVSRWSIKMITDRRRERDLLCCFCYCCCCWCAVFFLSVVLQLLLLALPFYPFTWI